MTKNSGPPFKNPNLNFLKSAAETTLVKSIPILFSNVTLCGP